MDKKAKRFVKFGEVLKMYRLISAHTQLSLEKSIGYECNGQYISNAERGLCSIPLRLFNKLAQSLATGEVERSAIFSKLREAYVEDVMNIINEGMGKWNA